MKSYMKLISLICLMALTLGVLGACSTPNPDPAGTTGPDVSDSAPVEETTEPTEDTTSVEIADTDESTTEADSTDPDTSKSEGDETTTEPEATTTEPETTTEEPDVTTTEPEPLPPLVMHVGNATVSAGNTVDVPVYIDETPGIYFASLRVTYDDTRLALNSVSLGDGMSGSLTYAQSIEWISDDGDVDYTGVMMVLHFTALDDAPLGDAQVGITYDPEFGDMIYNQDERDIVCEPTAGTITVTAPQPTIRVESTSAFVGNTVEVSVYIKNNPGIYCYAVGFEYDTTRLSLVDKAANTTDWGGSQTVGTKLVWDSSTGDIDFDGLMLTLTFEVLADAPVGDALVTITYDEGDLCNFDEEDVLPVVVPGYVTVKPSVAPPAIQWPENECAVGVQSVANASAGDTVTVEVYINNNPGIYCYTVGFEYDTTRLNLIGKAANTTDWGGSQTVGTKLVWDSSTGDIDFDGLMLTLTFEVLADAPVGDALVTIVYEEGDLCNYAEEDVNPVILSGYVMVG